MDNDYRQRLRDAYADRVLDDLADIASRSDSEYTRFHALKLLGQHHGLDHVLHQLMNLSHHAKSDWVRLQIASLVGHHLQLFTPYNKHRNAPPSLITLPEPNKPSHKLLPEVEHAITPAPTSVIPTPTNSVTPAPINSIIPAPEPESPRKEIRHSRKEIRHSHEEIRHSRESGNLPRTTSQPLFRHSRESGNLPRATSQPPPQDSHIHGNDEENSVTPAPTFPSYPRPAAGIPPSHPQPATTATAEPFNPWHPFKTNEAANTPTIAAIAKALHLAKSTTHPPDP